VSKKSISTRDVQRKFQRYLDDVAPAFAHADRIEPFEAYCKGLLLPGDRKSVEPMAARIAPRAVRSKHQSMHHFVATSTWSAQRVLNRVADIVIPAIEKSGPITSWIIDDTGIPKKGKHSVGVAHQYCGQLGKQANCQVAVTLSVANDAASLPIAHRLYLPESWTEDRERCEKVGVPKSIRFKTKLGLALEQLRHAVARETPRGVVLADAAYGNAAEFREGVTQLGLTYAVAVQSTTNVWRPGQLPLSPKRRTSTLGRPPSAFRQTAKHHPISVLECARELPPTAYRTVTWREGTNTPLSSRFAAVRVRLSHGHRPKSTLPAEEWLVIEWPENQDEPTKFWLSTLAESTSRTKLVASIMRRWRIERDYQELKSELGLGQYEGRSWLGFHHHAALCITAYGFLLLKRGAFSPSKIATQLPQPAIPKSFKPRGSPDSPDSP
jgi:SRSO17 transposase